MFKNLIKIIFACTEQEKKQIEKEYPREQYEREETQNNQNSQLTDIKISKKNG